MPGKCARSATYLGGRQHHLDLVEEELEARHRAARVSWATFGRFWSRSPLPKEANCLVFARTVVSALLSGLEALVLTDAQLHRLDSVILTYGRKLVRGAAGAKEVSADGDIKFTACTSRQVGDFLRLVPCAIELRIRRLRWLQQLVHRPVLHANLLASLFGRFPFESAQRPAFSCDTNPWARQLYDDVQQLVRYLMVVVHWFVFYTMMFIKLSLTAVLTFCISMFLNFVLNFSPFPFLLLTGCLILFLCRHLRNKLRRKWLMNVNVCLMMVLSAA